VSRFPLKRLFARPYRSIGPAEAAALAGQGAILLEVREDAEWRAGHAPKARHIPLGRLPQRFRDLPEQRTVVTVCRSGARSGRAASLLARQGRTVVNLAGGMRAWQQPGLPVVASGGRPGQVA
jgi:rhodanese-related sulfurtransferase